MLAWGLGHGADAVEKRATRCDYVQQSQVTVFEFRNLGNARPLQ